MTARRIWAWPLVPLYAAGLAAKDGLRAAGVLGAKKLQWPVVSVGSLSAGGAGKTPVVIALAELLRNRDWRVDVLSRGYGRSGTGVERVDPTTADAAARFGDEPVVVAQRTGVPVWVGAERFAAGTLAEAEGGERGVHLLDDGFQHRGLERVLDVVLVTEEDLDDALLPAGNLREPLSALTRADVVVVREEERERVVPRIRELTPEDVEVWSIRRELQIAEASAVGPRPVAFCAIARPAGFSAMLAKASFSVIATVEFGDHDRYDAASIDRLIKVARDCEATGFLTTEKDAVKLSREMMHRLEQVGPVTVAGLDARFVDEARVVQELEARIS